MDINERINEKRNASDELKKMLDDINREKNKVLLLIEQHFNDDEYGEAKEHLIKFNFYDNVAKKIVDLLD